MYSSNVIAFYQRSKFDTYTNVFLRGRQAHMWLFFKDFDVNADVVLHVYVVDVICGGRHMLHIGI